MLHYLSAQKAADLINMPFEFVQQARLDGAFPLPDIYIEGAPYEYSYGWEFSTVIDWWANVRPREQPNVDQVWKDLGMRPLERHQVVLPRYRPDFTGFGDGT